MPKPTGISTPSGLGIPWQVGPVTAASALPATITRVQYKHQYPATSGQGYAFTSNNTAGNLLVICMSSTLTSFAYTVTDTIGNSWTALPFHNFNTSKGIQIFYVLSCLGGANTVTVTTDGGDLGWTAIEYHGRVFSKDASLANGSFKNGVLGGNTTTPTTDAWSTGGANDVIVCAWADESTGQASVTAGTNFTIIQVDPSDHLDAQEEWLNASPQTNQTASFTLATTCNTWGLYLAAFTTT